MRPYEKTWRSLAAVGGQKTVWALGFPGRCTLTKLFVRQVGGDLVDFTLDVFNAERAAVSSLSSGGVEDPDNGLASPDLYKVSPTLVSVSPGVSDTYFNSVSGVFVNRDAGGPANRKNMIYLEIEPAGGGDCTFDVSLTALLPQ